MNVLLEKKIDAEGGLTVVYQKPEREIIRLFGNQALREILREAAFVCEDVIPARGETDEEKRENIIAAWQCLINTGLAWQLQGWFGRQAAQMIEEGLCKSAPRT